MKKRKKVLLGILAILLLAILSFGIWQRNNIRAIYTVLTQDSETIAQNLEQKRMDYQEKIEQQVQLNVSPLTTEQSNAVLNGTKTPEEVKTELGISEQLANSTDREENVQDIVNNCVAELYACKVDVMAQLAVLKQEALNDWHSLPENQQTSNRLYEIGFQGLEKCYDLEVTVDDQVQEILDRYQEKAKALHADTKIFTDLWTYYSDEKNSEKAYYLDKYMK